MPGSPLAALGPELSPEQISRYRRNIDIPGMGELGQRRLCGARVLVVGAGGLGSPVLLYLAAAGVGHIGVIDGDVVEVMNLQRQVLHTVSGTGTNKALSAKARLAELNPEVDVTAYPFMLTAENGREIVAGYDIVLDCCDKFEAKFLVSDLARHTERPLVWAAVVGMNAQLSVFGVPTADGEILSLRDLYPEVPPTGTYPLAVDVGVLGATVGQIASVQATQAILLLAGFGEPLVGRMLVMDAAQGRYDVLPLSARLGTKRI